MSHGYLLFALAFLVSVATPGPDVLAVVGRALAARRRLQCAGLILGIVAGKLILLTAALLGLVAVAKLLGPLFVAIKVIGGLYLIYLGIRLWRRQSGEIPADEAPGSLARDSAAGLAIALGNPVAILFYAALLPNSVDVASATFDTFIVLAAIVGGCTIAIYALYAGLAARIGYLFRGRTARRRLNRGSAAVMIGAGVAISLR